MHLYPLSITFYIKSSNMSASVSVVEAKSACQAAGSNLVSIDSESKNTFIIGR